MNNSQENQPPNQQVVLKTITSQIHPPNTPFADLSPNSHINQLR